MIAHMENIIDHRLLCLFERPVLRALLDEILDLVFRDRIDHMGIDADEEKEEIGRA